MERVLRSWERDRVYLEPGGRMLAYACRRDRATCPAKTVAQLRYTRSNVPITGLTDKLTRMGQIEGLFNRLPVTGGKLFRNTMRPWHRRIFRS